MRDFSWEWLNLHWFTPQTLSSFDWYFPLALYAIALIPLLYLLRWLFQWRFLQKLDVALLNRRTVSDPTTWLRFVPPLLLSLALALCLVALARPQKTDEQVDQWTEGIDIMLALDISESMKIEDFSPNRLEAAKEVAHNFIAGRTDDRIGMVIFSGEAISYCPLTIDHPMLNQMINEIHFGMIEKGGTAIGSALAVGLNRMRESETKSKVLILLSDGENTAGSIDPITSANMAYAYGIKMYTIGIGKEGKVPFGTDMFGRTRYIEQSLDEPMLREIAKIGEGRYFRATNNDALDQVFRLIDKYEKAEIKETRYKNTEDFYHIYLFYALLVWLLWMLSKSTFMSSALQD